MGRILPIRSRGAPPPPSQLPREPSSSAPTKKEFDSISIRDLLAYVLPIMKCILRDSYAPILKDVDDWYEDPAGRSLRGKRVRYGMFDRTSETDALVDEVVRILLGRKTKGRFDLGANGDAGDHTHSHSDDAIDAVPASLPDDVSRVVFLLFSCLSTVFISNSRNQYKRA